MPEPGQFNDLSRSGQFNDFFTRVEAFNDVPRSKCDGSTTYPGRGSLTTSSHFTNLPRSRGGLTTRYPGRTVQVGQFHDVLGRGSLTTSSPRLRHYRLIQVGAVQRLLSSPWSRHFNDVPRSAGDSLPTYPGRGSLRTSSHFADLRRTSSPRSRHFNDLPRSGTRLSSPLPRPGHFAGLNVNDTPAVPHFVWHHLFLLSP